MCAFFDGLNVDDAVDYQSVAGGEYQLQVVAAGDKKSGPQSKNPGTDMLEVQLRIMGNDMAKDVYEYFLPPNTGDLRTDNGRKLQLKNFLIACGKDTRSTPKPQELVGCAPWAILEERSDDRGKSNRVKSWIARK